MGDKYQETVGSHEEILRKYDKESDFRTYRISRKDYRCYSYYVFFFIFIQRFLVSLMQ